MLWSQRQTRGMHEAEISIQISVLAGVEPQTLESSGRESYHYTAAHFLLLVASYDMQEDTAGQF